jgi:proteasome lid subunit RPN8/RPN11
MKILDTTLSAIREHAATEAGRQRECCGLILLNAGKQSYVPCRNISTGGQEFIIEPTDWADAEDKGDIQAVVHSHVGVAPEPSQADLIGIESTNKPWLIVNMPTGEFTVTMPSGYVAPLIGRQFVHEVTDCYSLIRDYYQQELGIPLKDYARDHEWWRKGQNLYRELFDDAGFDAVALENLREHDVILMRLASKVDNHGAIYLGNNRILHHPMTRLSCRDIYGKGSYWHKISSGALRHRSMA